MRRTLFLIASVLVSAVFLWLALRNVPLNEIVDSITHADLGWVLLSLVAISLGMWTRGYRWYGLLDFKIPFLRAAHILNVGFFLNLLPLRAGEVVRALLATQAGVPVMTAATSVIVERMLDTLLVVLALVIAIPRLPNVPDGIIGPTNLFGVAVVSAFVVLIFFSRFPDIGHRVLEVIERFLPFLKRLGLNRLFDHVLDGLKPLTHWRSAAHAILWTLIAWAISLFTLYCLVRALRFEGDQMLLSVTGLALTSFSIAIPVSVAGLGPFQAALLVAGQAMGAPDAQSLSLGFLFHGVNILGYVVWGVVGLLTMGLSVGELLNRKQPAATSAASGGNPS
jgi:uncharacterized protein (TIRG00374 family)